jgi:type VI secretion system protein ImpB
MTDSSQPPKERVNIQYQTLTNGVQQDVELPLRILAIGNYTGRLDDRPVEEREPISVDKENFEQVMSAQNLTASISVPNRLSDEQGPEMTVDLSFRNLKDFRPEAIVKQVPELQRMMELREAIRSFKSLVDGGNFPKFKKRLEDVLRDPAKLQRLMHELEIEDGTPA